MKYVSIKSIVMIIAITFSGSQARSDDYWKGYWEDYWNKVNKCPVNQNACMKPIKQEKQGPPDFYVLFDIKQNGCLPSAALSEDGVLNKGIKIEGTVNGSCSYQDQLKDYSNTIYRNRCINSKGSSYCVRMFALYFVKDQTYDVDDALGSHTNDWEFALVWTKDNELTHASYSEHGHVYTKTIESLKYKSGMNQKFVYVDYYKDDGSTHPMRLPDKEEAEKRKVEDRVENPTHDWFLPPVVDWDKLAPNLREKFTTHDYGSADMPMTPKNFYANIKKGIEGTGYPSALYSSLRASDFEGVWKVVDTRPRAFNPSAPQNFVEITLSPLSKAKEGEAKANSGEVGTWKQEGTKDNTAKITWNTGWTMKLAKEDDEYKSNDDRKDHPPLESTPAQKVR